MGEFGKEEMYCIHNIDKEQLHHMHRLILPAYQQLLYTAKPILIQCTHAHVQCTQCT